MLSARQTQSGRQVSALPAPGSPDPYAAFRFVGNAAALVILAALLAEFISNFRHPTDRDFLGVWAAAQLALGSHAAAAYDRTALHAVEAAAATFGSRAAELPFPYPPFYLLLVIPFAIMSFPAAMAAWSLATFAFYLSAARRLLPRSGWLAAAFPAVFANAAIGQNGFLTAGIFMIGLSLLGQSPVGAGLVLGCLILKPQLGILLPVALIAGRQWRAVAGAAISSSAIMLLGLALFGTATSAAWLHEAEFVMKITREGLVPWTKLASVYAAARQSGIGPEMAIAIHATVAIAAAALVWCIWRSPAGEGTKVSILAGASMLMSPYLFYYDALILVPSFFWLASKGTWPVLLLVLWCLPLVMMGQMSLFGGSLNLNPILPILLVTLTCRHWRAERSAVRLEGPKALTFEQPWPVRVSQPVER